MAPLLVELAVFVGVEGSFVECTLACTTDGNSPASTIMFSVTSISHSSPTANAEAVVEAPRLRRLGDVLEFAP